VYIMEKQQGIKSISKRLERLESHQKIDDESEDEDPLSLMVVEMKKKESNQKKQTMKSILEHYQRDMMTHITGTSDDYLVAVLCFTIKYVEVNCIELATKLSVKICSEFKRSLCKSLVRSIIKGYSDELLNKSIQCLHELIYPKEKEKEEKKKKSSFFSR
jgi:hypothetical protein